MEINELIKLIGDDPSRKGLRETDVRVKRFIRNFFTYGKKLKLLSSEERNKYLYEANTIPVTYFSNADYDDLIIKEGEETSFCEHHILPYMFKYIIAYIPKEKIVGLSKLGEIVKYFAHRLTIQEELTKQIADWIDENLQPKGVMVVIKGQHLCAKLTANQEGEFTTSAIRGVFANPPEGKNPRMEVLQLIKF